MGKKRIEELRQQIEELKKRWPQHSVPPAMMARLDELEEELIQEMSKADEPDEVS